MKEVGSREPLKGNDGPVRNEEVTLTMVQSAERQASEGKSRVSPYIGHPNPRQLRCHLKTFRASK